MDEIFTVNHLLLEVKPEVKTMTNRLDYIAQIIYDRILVSVN